MSALVRIIWYTSFPFRECVDESGLCCEHDGWVDQPGTWRYSTEQRLSTPHPIPSNPKYSFNLNVIEKRIRNGVTTLKTNPKLPPNATGRGKRSLEQGEGSSQDQWEVILKLGDLEASSIVSALVNKVPGCKIKRFCSNWDQ
ncbi:hypothetical protein Taro_013557, partial [Colocasia esculenta]|nr:hypothetical protein [Colocasia esculenta]